MKSLKKNILKSKLLILIILFFMFFSVFNIGKILASSNLFIIKNVIVSSISDTAELKDLKFDEYSIFSDIVFHKLEDSITYKITIKNNDKANYTIKSISDNNENEYISYLYDNYEGTKFNSNEEITFIITEKYNKELNDISLRNQLNSVIVNFVLEAEDGTVTEETISIDTSSNPKTGDNIGLYLVTLIISFIALIIIFKKNVTNKKSNRAGKHSKKILSLFIIGILILPAISKAVSNDGIILSFENKVSLKDKLIVNYVIDNIENSLVINYNEKISGLNIPEKDGYNFNGWKTENGDLFDLNTHITDDIKIIADYTPINYTITYNLNGGSVDYENPSEYSIESDDIILNNPTREGYDFVGWTGTELYAKTENVEISKGSKGNRQYEANWTPTVYTITYHLDGGIVTTSNPTQYTIESDDITLNNPIKDGYTFTGWTGTDILVKKQDVTILKGSIGNKQYIANYTPTNYSISYVGLTAEEEASLGNLTVFNIETETTILRNPANRKDSDGDLSQIFIGWKDGNSISTNITIPSELKNKTFEAMWQTADPNIYTITYDLDGGTVSTSNPTTFTKFDDTFTLNNPTKKGYTFTGWTGSNGTTPQTVVSIPKGTRDNLNYTANWSLNTYTISYNLNGGSETTSNPTEYTVETENILLNNPTKEGYTFTGWTGSDHSEKTLELFIEKGSVGNRQYTANWEANTYNIIFENNTGSGSMPNQVMTYDKEENLDKNTFTKDGYSFVNWNLAADGSSTSYGDKVKVKNLATNGNVYLYAQWELSGYSIEFNANGGTGNMSPQIVLINQSVSINKNTFTRDGYEFDGWNTKPDGSGTIYTDEQSITISENTILYAQWKKVNINVLGTKLDKAANIRNKASSLGKNFNSMTAFLRSSTAPDSGVNKIDVSIAGLPVYIWWDNTTLYWYSEDPNPLLNEDLGNFFKDCTVLSDISGLEDFDSSKVNIMQCIFQNTKALSSVSSLSKWRIIGITRMEYAFLNSAVSNLHGIETWDVSKVSNMESIFANCTNLTDITPLSNWNIKSATDINGLFNNCRLTSISALSNWNTSNVQTMVQTFYGNKNITSLEPLSNWNTTNLKSLDRTFYQLENVTSLEPLQNWNTTNSSLIDLNQTFAGMKKITNLEALTNWNVSNVSRFSSTFDNCELITSIAGLKDWDVSNATTMVAMFYNLNILKDASAIVDWNVTSSINFRDMFKKCNRVILNPFNKLPGTWSNGTYTPTT